MYITTTAPYAQCTFRPTVQCTFRVMSACESLDDQESRAACSLGAREAHVAPAYATQYATPSLQGASPPGHLEGAYALGWQSVALGCPSTCT
jgi:hypothetical protein